MIIFEMMNFLLKMMKCVKKLKKRFLRPLTTVNYKRMTFNPVTVGDFKECGPVKINKSFCKTVLIFLDFHKNYKKVKLNTVSNIPRNPTNKNFIRINNRILLLYLSCCEFTIPCVSWLTRRKSCK